MVGGIAVGPAVGFTSDYAYNNKVEHNYFHDLGEGVIADFGCVHFANVGGVSQPLRTGDTFSNNVCRDITSAPEWYQPNGGTGIYIDNDSQYITAVNNLVYRTSGASFFQQSEPSLWDR